MRGFEDLGVDSDNYSGTATRWGQRLIASVAVQKGWKLFMADVSTAFLQSMSFSEMSKLTGQQEREVSFTPPSGSEIYFRELPGMQKYNPTRHVLRMLKAVYGLKDAPKCWKLQLERALRNAGGKPLCSDKCLWTWWSGGELTLLLSTHVDDLKGCGRKAETDLVLKFLTKEFGELKMAWDNFEHCGIKYVTQDDGSIVLYRHHYAQQLSLIDEKVLMATKPEEPLNTLLSAQYLSLLGGLSWLLQTQLEVAVYVCALQRKAKAPKCEHAVRLNRCVK